MSTNEPGEHNWPNPRTDADLAIDPSTSPAVLASLAEDRPGVRYLVATNPSAPVHILMWLHELRDPAIDLALSRNPTATAANVVRPLSSAASAAPALDASLSGAQPPPTEPVALVGAAAPTAAIASATTVLERPARRWSTWAILLVPLLALGAIAALVLRVRDTSSDKTAGGVTTGPSTSVIGTRAPAVGSTQVTAAATAAPPPVTPAPTEAPTEAPTPAPTPAPAPATTRKPTTATTRTATTVKTTTPPTTGRATASVSPTTAVPPTVLAVTVVPTTTATAVNASTANAASATAQRLATALASSDWATARKLNPAGALTDAQYGKDYGNLTDSALVPVSTTAVGGTVYNLRLGLVAHETTAAGVRSTLLYCVHWNVDTAAGTVVQVDGTKVRTATGRVEAAAVTAELKTACGSAKLK